MPEILCVFLPNQRSAGREVVSCLLTRKSLDILALVRLARFCSRRKVSITAQNVQGIVGKIDGEIRWTFCRYWYSSVFPSVRDLFKDVLTDSSNKIAAITFDLTIIFVLPPYPGRGISRNLTWIAMAITFANLEKFLIARATRSTTLF